MKQHSHINLHFDYNQQSRIPNHAIATGFSGLDAILPQGGLPIGGVTEIFCPQYASHNALNLVLPALARLSQAKRWLAWIAPPNTPSAAHLQSAGLDLKHLLMIHPHATTNGLWAIEQALRASTCAAVLSWVNSADHQQIQDLRGAAYAGNTCGIMFRPDWAINQRSAAALRLNVVPHRYGMLVELLKERKPVESVYVELSDQRPVAC